MRKRFKRYPPFVMLERATLDSREWKELTKSEMIAYIYIKKNYNGRNNGKIPCPYSNLKHIMKSNSTISAAVKGLKNKGWIDIERHGGLHRHYNLFRLTGKYDRIR